MTGFPGTRSGVRQHRAGRKNYLFAGSDAGGNRAAAIYSLTETAKLNGLDPGAWLHDVVARIADHPINRIAEPLPWKWTPQAQETNALRRSPNACREGGVSEPDPISNSVAKRPCANGTSSAARPAKDRWICAFSSSRVST